MNDPYPGIIPSRASERRILLGAAVICEYCRGTGKRRAQKVDIPLRLCSTGTYYRYPLQTMLVGESFFVPNQGKTTEQTQNKTSGSIGYVQRTTGKRFTQRRYSNGIRVWRVA